MKCPKLVSSVVSVYVIIACSTEKERFVPSLSLGIPAGEEDESQRHERQQKEEDRQFRTKVFGDVEVVVKDPEFSSVQPRESEFPRTLEPQLVRDRFAVQRDSALDLDPSSVIRTEYSTFSYFLTSLENGQTVTKTDIVVSSQIVTDPAGLIRPTPTLQQQITPSSSPTHPSELSSSGVQQPDASTHFTTTTYYTTFIDRGSTITKTRTKVKSSEEETSSSATVLLQPGENEVKYLSLGPNIYGKIKTIFATYTYFTTNAIGGVAESKEIITQLTTSLFSTTKLPDSITVFSGALAPSVQLKPEDLHSLKNSFLSSSGGGVSFTTTTPASDGGSNSILDTQSSSTSSSSSQSLPLTGGSITESPFIETRPPVGPGVGFDQSHLSSLKESFSSLDQAASTLPDFLQESSTSVAPGGSVAVTATPTSKPLTDINLPEGGPTIVRPPGVDGEQQQSTTGQSISPSQPLATGGHPQGTTVAPGGGGGVGGGADGQQNTSGGSSSNNGSGSSSSTDPANANSTTGGSNNGTSSVNGTQTGGSGVIDAVVGGLADGLGGVFGSGGISSTPSVNLGPVLDAVATLLRGPIRSAIANRRSEIVKKSDGPSDEIETVQQSATLPAFARLPAQEPNFIPVGGFAKEAPHHSKINYEFIPLQQREGGSQNNGPVPSVAYRKDQISRSDDEDDIEFTPNALASKEPVVTVPQEVYEKLKTHKEQDKPVFLDNDRLIINDHIIKSTDPQIIDVLNRFEQSHLFGKYEGKPMSIKIVPGVPMTPPNSAKVPASPYNSKDIVYVPPLEEYQDAQRPPFRAPQPENVRPETRGPPNRPKKQAQPPPPPVAPQPQRPLGPQGRPPLPQRPLENRPPTPPSSPVRPVPNRPYSEGPRRPEVAEPNNDLDDSVNEFSVNNEVVVKPPPNVLQEQLAKNPGLIGPLPSPNGQVPNPNLPGAPRPERQQQNPGQHGPGNPNYQQSAPNQQRPPPSQQGPNAANQPKPQFNPQRLPPPPPPQGGQQRPPLPQNHQQRPPLPQNQQRPPLPQNQQRPPLPQNNQQQRPPGPNQPRPNNPNANGPPPQNQQGQQQLPPPRPSPNPPTQSGGPSQSVSWPQSAGASNNQLQNSNPNKDNPPPALPPPTGIVPTDAAPQLNSQPNAAVPNRPPYPPQGGLNNAPGLPPTQPTTDPQGVPDNKSPPLPVPTFNLIASPPPPTQPQRPQLPQRPVSPVPTPPYLGQNDRKDGPHPPSPPPPPPSTRPEVPQRPQGSLRPGSVTFESTTHRASFPRPRPKPYSIPPSEYAVIDNPSLGPVTNGNPNKKARKPGQSGNSGQVEEVTTGSEKPDQVRPSIAESLEPSFTVNAAATPQGNSATVPVTTGSLIQSDKPGKPDIEYQGWYTEGDSIPAAQKATASAIPFTVREKEAPKTTTYANEWAAVDEGSADVHFTPQRKPDINTNFEREWTVRDELIEPTRPLVELSKTRPFPSRYTNEWGSYIVKTRESSLSSDSSSSSSSSSSEKPADKPIEEKPISGEVGEDGFPREGSIENVPVRTRPDYQAPPPRPTAGAGQDPEHTPVSPQGGEEEAAELVTSPAAATTGAEQPEHFSPTRPTVDREDDDIVTEKEGGFGSAQGFPIRQDGRPNFAGGEPDHWSSNSGASSTPPAAGSNNDGPIPIEIEGSYVPSINPSSSSSSIHPNSLRPSSSSLIDGRLPPGIEPDIGTFINIDKTQQVVPSKASSEGHIGSTTLEITGRPSIINKDNFVPTRPSIFTPRLTKEDKESSVTATTAQPSTEIKIAGFPFFGSNSNKPGSSSSQIGSSAVNKQNDTSSSSSAAKHHAQIKGKDDEAKRKEIAGDSIDGAIVESIPGHSLSAEDSEPETKCQNTCGRNEICQISTEEINCQCRPGFGRIAPAKECKKSRSYQVEVLTTSQSEAITVVKWSPKAVQKAVDETLRKNIKDIYQGSEFSSFKAGNTTKRNVFGGGEKNMTKNEQMAINMVVHIAAADNDNDGKRLQSLLEEPLKETKLPLGSDITVSRVSVDDYDECSNEEQNDCAEQALCTNTEGSYTCECKEGFHDLSDGDDPGRVCSATSTATECELCNRNGECVVKGSEITCECRDWFAGRNCQINLKLLLIVGCVSVGLMIFIACGVSCFCCRDKAKNIMPSPYGTSSVVSRLPHNVRNHGLMMDPHGIKGPQMRQKPKKSSMASSSSGTLMPRPGLRRLRSASPGSVGGSSSGGWGQPRDMRVHPNPGGLVIPRARVSHMGGGGGGRANMGYHSDDDFMSPVEANRAMSERTSLSSRHQRRPRSLTSAAGSRNGGNPRMAAASGSIDPLLLDSDDSGGNNMRGRRGTSEMDAQSVARSYNETIIQPVTRAMRSSVGGASYRSSRSQATSEGGRTMAERDGGSSFVVSNMHQLYRLHDSDGSLDSL